MSEQQFAFNMSKLIPCYVSYSDLILTSSLLTITDTVRKQQGHVYLLSHNFSLLTAIKSTRVYFNEISHTFRVFSYHMQKSLELKVMSNQLLDNEKLLQTVKF